MTAVDPRVGEIENRANNPFSPDNTRAQMDADRDYLLAELRKARERARRVAAVATRYRNEWRKRDEALDRVADLAKYLDGLAPGDQHYAKLIRAAVTGDGA